jgi:hypothetical protein
LSITGVFEAPKVSLVGWTVIDTNSCPCPQLLKTRSKATATMRATTLNHFLFMKDSWILRPMNALSGERANLVKGGTKSKTR